LDGIADLQAFSDFLAAYISINLSEGDEHLNARKKEFLASTKQKETRVPSTTRTLYANVAGSDAAVAESSSSIVRV